MSKYIDKDSVASKVLTIRDWFAGQALSGFLANGNDSANATCSRKKEFVQQAYEMAELMLEERKS